MVNTITFYKKILVAEKILEKQNKIKIESKWEGKKFREASCGLPGSTGDSPLQTPEFMKF